MLRSVAAGERDESLRLYRPDDALLFSSLDARRPGYAEAVRRARAGGFEPVIRLAGGHAAVFLEDAVAFAWASRDADAQLHITERFERLTGWIVRGLRGLGLDARLGEVPGEYCPGEYSVNLAGRVKVMGVGQRVIRGGAHVGGVLTIARTDALREILVPVYEALELPFDPGTAGGVADFAPSLRAEDVIGAIAAEVRAEGVELAPARFDAGIEGVARTLAARHAPDRAAEAGRGLRRDGAKTLVHGARDGAADES